MAEQQTNQTGATREAAGPAGEAIKARARDALWRVWTPLAAVAARGYVAGPHLADALRASEALSRQGFTVTLCHWSPVGTGPRRCRAPARRCARGRGRRDGTLCEGA